MTIQQFGSLFKAFKIYPVQMVEQFLKSYEIPSGLTICDPTWLVFISEIVSRFGGARNHYFLLDFLTSVASAYLKDKRQKQFVTDLLQLKVPKLFAVEEGEDEEVRKEDLQVATKFSAFLKSYILRHALKHSLLNQMTDILV